MRKQLAATFLIITLLLVGPTFAINSLKRPPIFGSATHTNIVPATANKLGTQTDAVSMFDTCLQDDSNGNSLQFNSTTGDYIFTTSGPNGFTLGGRANLTIRGSIITLQQNGPDRRVLAKIDNSVHKGTAAVQVFSLGRTLTIMDRNTADSVCPPPQQSGVITPNGGTISIPGLTTITFPAGAFPFDTSVNVSITQSAETQEDFNITTAIFSAGSRLPFEVRINSGSVAPSTTFQATVQVPNSFLSQLPTNAELQAFAQIFEDGGEETLDSFELFPSSFDSVTKKIQVTLPAEAFTNRRTDNETFEAIIVIGTTTTQSLTSMIHANENISQREVVQSFAPNQSLAVQDTCEGTSLGPPLRGSLRVTSRFNSQSEHPHYGTDYAASTGDDVLAVADGKISKIGFQSENAPNSRCPGKLIRGWGNYVILEHADGRSHTLYAHLKMATASEGQTVTRGTVIGKADDTGGSCGSHLHLEYAPRGDILQKGNKVNPEPCVGLGNPGCNSFLSFVTGNPGIPGDGIFITSGDAIFGDVHFGLSQPISLGTFSDGFTFTVFLPSNIPADPQSINIEFDVIISGAPSLRCSAGFGRGDRRGVVSVNNVRGILQNITQSDLQDIVTIINRDSQCHVSLSNLFLTSIRIDTFVPSFQFIRSLDAAALCPGQNNFPGIRIQ